MEPFAQRIILGKRNVQIRGERRQCLRKLERGDFAVKTEAKKAIDLP